MEPAKSLALPFFIPEVHLNTKKNKKLQKLDCTPCSNAPSPPRRTQGRSTLKRHEDTRPLRPPERRVIRGSHDHLRTLHLECACCPLPRRAPPTGARRSHRPVSRVWQLALFENVWIHEWIAWNVLFLYNMGGGEINNTILYNIYNLLLWYSPIQCFRKKQVLPVTF